MTPLTLLCPQCGSPLARQALWRIVSCSYCGADVTRSEALVRAADFHAAYLRSHDTDAAHDIVCAGQRYQRIAHLGAGASASVSLADRGGAMPRRVVLKIAHGATPAGHLAREKAILDQLQADHGPGAAYFTQRLPQAVAVGSSSGAGPDATCEVLVLRHPTGFWGSLADVRLAYGRAIDPRHVVWMWRRVLEVLAYVHAGGWSHGRLAPQHLLVHPADHGVLIIGWSGARRGHDRAAQARDLVQLAWSMRALLSDADADSAPVLTGATPAALVRVLERASTDPAWCASLGAEGLRQVLGGAAKEAFGPARFIDFSPTPST
jgi:hypothetical protein